MWESAKEFGALLLFAEHRYYGESKPYTGKELKQNMQYLTAEQAMADYAELLTELKSDLQAENSPVIGFGGSYGGMLAAWMRMKYPHILDGAIAASAPIWCANFALRVTDFTKLELNLNNMLKTCLVYMSKRFLVCISQECLSLISKKDVKLHTYTIENWTWTNLL